MRPDIIAAAKALIRCVEFDVNGENGKGGNGGLTSNETIRAAGNLRVQIDRAEKEIQTDD
jgi:hypothetical protein